MLALACIGYARWYVVHSAQTRLFAQLGDVLDRTVAIALDPTSGVSHAAANSLGAKTIEIESSRLVLAAAGSLSAMLFGLAVFAGCLWVSHGSGHFGLTAIMGAWGWLVSGTTVAAITSGGYSMIRTLQTSIPFRSPTMPSAPTSVPFSVLVILGLVSSMLWLGLLPWILGWFLGSRLREWRMVALPFDVRSFAEDDAVADVIPRITCSCGTKNLVTSASCYACGAVLSLQDPGA